MIDGVAMGDDRREAQMLKVERSRDSLPEAFYFRKSMYLLPMEVDRSIRNNIVCSIFLDNLVQRETEVALLICRALK